MFLIVGGMPRSGTTAFRRMWEIFLPTEIPVYDVQCHLLDCLRGVQTGMEMRGVLDEFREREERFVKEMFFAANRQRGELQAAREHFEGARVHGHKTPSSELTFAEYEELLGRHHPRYVYCLRDPVACLNSRFSMPWKEMSFQALIEKLRESYHAFLAAIDRHPDRLFLFRIEEYAADPKTVAARLCEFLALDPGPSDDMAPLRKLNSSAKLAKRGKLRDRELSAEEVDRIRNDPLVRDVTERFGWRS